MEKNGFTHESHVNKTIEWYTPPWIFIKLGLKFDLDPASPKEPVSWIPADKTYSIADDGLIQPWKGLVWLNPPYGSHTSAWLKRMHQHRNGVALVFSRTDCRWYHDYVAKADAILFLKGRVSFVDADGVTEGRGAGCGSMLVAWGDKSVKALMKMQEYGHLVIMPQMG